MWAAEQDGWCVKQGRTAKMKCGSNTRNVKGDVYWWWDDKNFEATTSQNLNSKVSWMIQCFLLHGSKNNKSVFTCTDWAVIYMWSVLSCAVICSVGKYSQARCVAGICVCIRWDLLDTWCLTAVRVWCNTCCHLWRVTHQSLHAQSTRTHCASKRAPVENCTSVFFLFTSTNANMFHLCCFLCKMFLNRPVKYNFLKVKSYKGNIKLVYCIQCHIFLIKN
jgi:hypothetical protein